MDRSWKQRLKCTPGVRVVIGFGIRAKDALGELVPALLRGTLWVLRSREITNYTYALSPLNRAQLCSMLADVTGCPYERVDQYIAELENDHELRAHIKAMHEQSDERVFADPEPLYCRRLGWYACARIMKPKVIVETGVDKGMGSCVLCAALLRNAAEGHPGRFFGTDINPKAGYMLAGRYREVGEILYGDSIQTLERFAQHIDLFINDSDHSHEYEAREYRTIEPRLDDKSIIIADNAHVSDSLRQFALRTGRSFLFFREQPVNHWYRGGGIGFAFKRAATA